MNMMTAQYLENHVHPVKKKHMSCTQNINT